MPTVIFRNASSIENKISQSANKASFEEFFMHVENYEVYCDELAESLSIGERIRALSRKKEYLEAMQKDIPILISKNETAVVKSIKANLDAIKASIPFELEITEKALTAAREEEKKALKS